MNDILRHRRDEATVVAPPTDTITLPIRISAGPEDWRANV